MLKHHLPSQLIKYLGSDLLFLWLEQQGGFRTKNNELQTIASEQYRQLKPQLGTEIQLYYVCSSFLELKLSKKRKKT